MLSLFDFSQAIRQLNKAGKFHDALKYFKENKANFSSEQIGGNQYIVSDVLSALIEINRYDMIFHFIQTFNVVLHPQSFSFLLKKFKDKSSINWVVVDKFCELVPVESLDTECKVITVQHKGKTKDMELASSQEEWYSIKTKALYETNQYERCFEVSKKALDSLEKFHYSNDVWFARRIALSKRKLGDSKSALDELLLILKRKKEWFIQSEIAEIYKEQEETDKAFQYAIDAVNNFGDLEYKISLIFMIGELLLIQKNEALAFKHFSLCSLLRQQQEWKIPNDLKIRLNQLGFAPIPLEKIKDLRKELSQYWNSFKTESVDKKDKVQFKKQLLQGKIDKILHNNERGIDGFIKYDTHKSIYFCINQQDPILEEIKVGLSVEFSCIPAINGKKDKAINLKII